MKLFSKRIKNVKSIPKSGDKESLESDKESGGKIPTKDSPFCYAVSYWLGHARAVPSGPEATPLSKTLWKLVEDFSWHDDRASREWMRVHPYKNVEIHVADSIWCYMHERRARLHSGLYNPLHIAASYGLIDILDWAHPQGIDFNSRDSRGWTPLLEATHIGGEKLVMSIMMKEGVDVNICASGIYNTPLTRAACHGYNGIVEILLRQDGIDVDKLDTKCNSALGIAISEGNEKMIGLLLQKGAKVSKYEGKDISIPSKFESSAIPASDKLP